MDELVSPPSWDSWLRVTARGFLRGSVGAAIVTSAMLCGFEALALDVLTARGPAWNASFRAWPLHGGFPSVVVDLGVFALGAFAMHNQLAREFRTAQGIAPAVSRTRVAAIAGMLGIYPVMPELIPLRVPVAFLAMVLIVRWSRLPRERPRLKVLSRLAVVAGTASCLVCLGWVATRSVLHPFRLGGAGQSDGAVFDVREDGGITVFRFRPSRDSVFPIAIENEGVLAANVLSVVPVPKRAGPLRVIGVNLAPAIPREDQPALTVERTRPFTSVVVPGRTVQVFALVLSVGACPGQVGATELVSAVVVRYRLLGRAEQETVRVEPSITVACAHS